MRNVVVGVQPQASSTLTLATFITFSVPSFFIYTTGLTAVPTSLGCFKDIHIHTYTHAVVYICKYIWIGSMSKKILHKCELQSF